MVSTTEGESGGEHDRGLGHLGWRGVVVKGQWGGGGGGGD